MKRLLAGLRRNPPLWLLAFVPVLLPAAKRRPEAHTLLFLLSVLAIVSLAALLGHATESVVAKTGDAAGGLLIATLTAVLVTTGGRSAHTRGGSFPMRFRGSPPASRTVVAMMAIVVAGLMEAPSAHASFLPPEMMDTAAMGLAWFVIIFVPIGGIVLFWLVHILPEKIAHKRHHPQRDAIQVLCLLSLVFGGMLWPIAWLWAYVKPVTYKMAYGTEKHDDYYHEMGAKAQAGALLEHELAHLREELDAMAAKGTLTAELKALRRDLAAVTPTPPGSVAAQAAAAGSAAAQAAPPGSAGKAGSA
jgi:Protein of unknown function (DUF3302)